VSSRAPHLQRLAELLTTLPLHDFLKLQLVEEPLGLRLPASPRLINGTGVVHGGILYSVLDVASFLALVVERPAQDAVTVDFSASMLRPAAIDQDTLVHARVLRAGKRLAHMDAEAWQAGQLVAVARVTKALINPPAAP